MLDMRTEEGTQAALGGLYPASSLYMDCAWVGEQADGAEARQRPGQDPALDPHPTQAIAAKMPAEYAGSTRSST